MYASRIPYADGRRTLLFTSLNAAIGDAVDGEECSVRALFAIKKRRAVFSDYEAVRTGGRLLKKLVSESGLPLLSNGAVRAFRILVPDGAVLPDPATAFERLVRLSLYKMDFFDFR